MRRSRARFSGPGASNRSPSWADSITATPGFKFSVHTGSSRPSIDTGFGYTYFNEETGHGVSAVRGFTGNFANTVTKYQAAWLCISSERPRNS